MGLENLEEIDADELQPDGTRLLQVHVDFGWRPEREALDHIQLLLKLAPLLAARTAAARRGGTCKIQVLSVDDPPASALQFMRAQRVTAGVWRSRSPGRGSASRGSAGPVRVAGGRGTRYPNLPGGEPDVNTLQAVNAADFCRQYGLDNSLRSLAYVDQLLDRCRDGLWLGPDERPSNGDLIVQAAAYTGEVLLTELGGTWIHRPELDRAGGWAVLVALGPDRELRVDVFERVAARLRTGAGAPVTALTDAVVARISDSRAAALHTAASPLSG